MLDAGASVNIYMFFGGTNFGFTAGCLLTTNNQYKHFMINLIFIFSRARRK